jgi:hypothetical protein
MYVTAIEKIVFWLTKASAVAGKRTAEEVD